MYLTSAKSRAIAQGEVLTIFVKVFPGTTLDKIDEVWAETDEGYESNHIPNPPLSETLQFYYYEEDTKKFYPGVHHIRIWGIDEGLHYVLNEVLITVNPAFPFTENTVNKDYEYKSPVSVSTTTPHSEVTNQVVYKGQIVSPAQWGNAVFIRTPEEGLPDHAQPGDICKLLYDPPTYWTCVSKEPIEWRKVITNIFVGSENGLVPDSNPLTQQMYLRGDGIWHVPDSGTIDTHNLIVIDEDTVNIDCQQF